MNLFRKSRRASGVGAARSEDTASRLARREGQIALRAATGSVIENLEVRLLFGYESNRNTRDTVVPTPCPPEKSNAQVSIAVGADPTAGGGPAQTTVAPVYFFDGSPLYDSTDLDGGSGFTWTRSWTGNDESSLNGNGWMVTQLPYLAITTNQWYEASNDNHIGIVDAIFDGGVQHRFDIGPNDYLNFHEDPGSPNNLKWVQPHVDGGVQYPAEMLFRDSAGDVTTFFDVPRTIDGYTGPAITAYGRMYGGAGYEQQITSTNASFYYPYGGFASRTDPYGNTTAATYYSNGQVEYVTRTESDGAKERFFVEYSTVTNALGGSASLVSRVTLQQPGSGTNWNSIRSAEYTYYGGSTNSADAGFGRLGDLKLVTIKDGAGNVVDNKYYRYNKFWSHQWSDGTGNYDGRGPTNDPATTGGTDTTFTQGVDDDMISSGLKTIVEGDAYARLTGAKGTSVASFEGLADSQIDPYAQNTFRYESYGANNLSINQTGTWYRVTQETAAGAGCSLCNGGFGTFKYSYSNTGTADPYDQALDAHTGDVVTTVTLPDSTPADDADNNLQIAYTNEYGQVVLEVLVDKNGTDDTSDDKVSGYAYVYDGAGHLMMEAEPSAVDLSDGLAGIDASNPLGYDKGHFSRIRDDQGVIRGFSFGGPAVAGSNTAGDVAFYLHDRTIQHGQLDGAMTASSIEPNGDYTATITFPSAHGLHVGDTIWISGAVEDAYNGRAVVASVPSSTTVTYYMGQILESGATTDGMDLTVVRPTLLERQQYYAQTTGGGVYLYPIASDTVYRNADGTGAETTRYSYSWYPGTLQIQSRTTTAPGISAAQNGPGTSSADVTVDYFDPMNRLAFHVDGDGHITYVGYATNGTGVPVKTIQDVDYSLLNSGEQGQYDGYGISHVTGGLALTTTDDVDGLGRVISETDPNGNVTLTRYNDAAHEIRVYPGWHAVGGGYYNTTGPVQIARTFRPGSNTNPVYIEHLTATIANRTTAPDGTESLATIQSLSRDYTNDAGQVVRTDGYVTFGSGTSATTFTTNPYFGTVNVNFYTTLTATGENGHVKRVVSANGTITRWVYDALGNVRSVWVGTNDTPVSGYWSPTNAAAMTKVQENFYDTYDPLTPGSGDGVLTLAIQYPNGTNGMRVTEYAYDWRDRPVAIKQGVLLDGDNRFEDASSETDGVHRLITYNTYDNVDELTGVDSYAGDGVGLTNTNHAAVTTNGVPDAPSSSKLRAHVTFGYDDQGRLYRTDQYDVTQSGTSAGSYGTNTLVSQSWYNHRGDVTATAAPGGLVTKYVIDGAGRTIRQYTSDGGQVNAPSTWQNWTNAASVANDIVLEQTDYTFDANSNVIATATRQRFHDDATNGAGLGALGDPSTGPKARVYYTANWFDAADRLTDSVDVGTNGTNGAYTRPSNAPTNSTDALHLTHVDFNDAGLTSVVTDAKGHKTLRLYDLLGRQTRSVSAWDGNTNALSINVSGSVFAGANFNQTTDTAYDGDDHVVLLTAWNKSGTNAATFQKTQYNYGVSTSAGSDVNSNDVLASVQYPDPSSGSPGGSNATEVFTVNALGDRTTFTDRNGTKHAYGFDALGRNTSDVVTAFGSGVDTNVQAIGTTFDDAGRVHQVTSYDGTNLATAAVLSQEQFGYNGLGQLTDDQQSSGGAVLSNTPGVAYVYDEMSGGANESRLVAEVYPNGRVVHYGYAGGLDAAIGRLTFIADDDGSGSVGTHLEEYKYLGLSTIVERTRPEPGTKLTLIQQSGDTLAGSDGGDQYVGLDRFGRIADQNWITYSGTSVTGTTDRFQYGYDANSNVLYKDNKVNSIFSELYHGNSASTGDDAGAYDALDRLTGFRRGTLSASGNNGSGLDTVTALNSNTNVAGSQSWNLDAQGNWAGVTTDGTSTSRTTDGQNELTGTATGTNTSSLTYDHDGNMLTDGAGTTSDYDAWNRLRHATTATSSTTYTYTGQRLEASARTTGSAGRLVALYYFDAQGRVVQQSGINDPGAQYVWGAGYVNDLVLRDRDADQDLATGAYGKTATSGTNATGFEERLYAQQDANWNVTSLTDASGIVKQRFVYDPAGKDAALNADWSNAGTNAAALSMDVKYQGMRQDRASGLYVTENRVYSATLGVWLQQEPYGAGYIDGSNLYKFAEANPIGWVDPRGLNGWDVVAALTAGGLTSLLPRDVARGAAQGIIQQGIGTGGIGSAYSLYQNYNHPPAPSPGPKKSVGAQLFELWTDMQTGGLPTIIQTYRDPCLTPEQKSQIIAPILFMDALAIYTLAQSACFPAGTPVLMADDGDANAAAAPSEAQGAEAESSILRLNRDALVIGGIVLAAAGPLGWYVLSRVRRVYFDREFKRMRDELEPVWIPLRPKRRPGRPLAARAMARHETEPAIASPSPEASAAN